MILLLAQLALAQPVDAQPVDAQPVDAQPVDAQPVDAQPVDAQPVDAQPVDAQPVDAQPVDALPEPAEADPASVEAQPGPAEKPEAATPDAEPAPAPAPEPEPQPAPVPEVVPPPKPVPVPQLEPEPEPAPAAPATPFQPFGPPWNGPPDGVASEPDEHGHEPPTGTDEHGHGPPADPDEHGHGPPADPDEHGQVEPELPDGPEREPPVVPEAPDTPEVAPQDPSLVPPTSTWLIHPPQQSPGRVLAFLVVMIVGTLAASLARRTRRNLRPGAIASLLRIADTAGRALLVLGGIGVVTQLIPSSLVAALPWALLGGAVAVGWSIRDGLPDLVAWIQISAEGSVRRGRWVRGEGFAGRVERIGLRATWLADDRGQRVAVPNRSLVHGTVRTDQERWYMAEVDLHLRGTDPARIRRALEHACLLSPWVAPEARVHVSWDPVEPDRWSLRVQLLEGGFAEAFRGAIRERVEELLRLP